VTSGATEALFAAITAVVHKGDEVIVLEPAFDSYVPAITLNGGVPVYVKFKFPEYRIDWDDVKDAVTSKTRLIILNSPHNPTGAVWSHEDITALKQIVMDTQALEKPITQPDGRSDTVWHRRCYPESFKRCISF